MNLMNPSSTAIDMMTNYLLNQILEAIEGITFQKYGCQVDHELLHHELHKNPGMPSDLYLTATDLAEIMIHLGYIRDYDETGGLIWTGIGLRSGQEETEPVMDMK